MEKKPFQKTKTNKNMGNSKKKYMCLVCPYLLKEGIELPCSHVYCNHCLMEWEDLKVKKENEEAEKPK